MALRVTRPAFMEGMRVWKASQGVDDYDVNRDATRAHIAYQVTDIEKWKVRLARAGVETARPPQASISMRRRENIVSESSIVLTLSDTRCDL